MSEDHEHLFNEDEFNEKEITLQEVAKIIVPMYKAIMSQGLSAQEAAALTAAYWAQVLPAPPVKPMED